MRQVNRRTALRIGAGTALATATAVALPATAAAVGGGKVRNLTGPAETGGFTAPWTDLGIPARCPDGSILLVCGDTFDGGGVSGPDWRAPSGLRCPSGAPGALVVTGSVGGGHAYQLVPEGHTPLPGGTSTAIPSDAATLRPAASPSPG